MFFQYLPVLLEGLKTTLYIAAFGLFFAIILGVILCFFMISGNKVLDGIATVYIAIIRGIPMMILALFVYFGILMNKVPTNVSGIIILTINASAYMAEIFRGGIEAVDKGQVEAARSLGMTYGETMVKVVLPQAVKIMIPSLMNQLIISLKDTAILTAISVRELTNTSQIIIARNFKAFEIYSYAAIIYFVVISILTIIQKQVERRLQYDKR